MELIPLRPGKLYMGSEKRALPTELTYENRIKLKKEIEMEVSRYQA
jgi:hypothetical protein